MAKKVLIVEDDKDFQDIYSLYLQGESFEVLKAFDGSQGLAVLDKETPDLIILDIIMPVMDGEEFYVRMRELEKCRSIPVIVASVNEKLPPRIAELGGTARVLKKPFDIEAMLQAVRENLKSS